MCTNARKIGMAMVAAAAMIVCPALAQRADDKAPQGRRTPERGRQAPEVRGVVKSVDTAKNSLTIAMPSRGREEEENTFTLSKDTEILFDAGRGRRAIVREGKLADLQSGSLVTLTMSADGKAIETVVAEGPTVQGIVKEVDAGKHTVTLASPRGRGEEPEDKAYSLGKKAEVVIDDGRGRRSSLKEGKLADVQPGAMAVLKLSVDQKTVESLVAEGPGATGIVKAVDVPNKTITLQLGSHRGEDGALEKTFTLAPDGDVLQDEGQGRGGFARVIKLADIPTGAMAMLRLSMDQKTAVLVRAFGPTVYGTLKGVDAGKRTVTVLVGAGRGSDGEEKTFTLAKGARVIHNGQPVKLADLKPADNTQVGVRLSLDQKTARNIVVVIRE